MSNSGALRKRITLQTENPATDSAGGYTLAWTDTLSVWADIEPLSGHEIQTASHLEGHVTHRVTMRYQNGITTDMRVVYGNRVFNIRSVLNNNESNRWLELLVEEGVAV